MTTAGNTEQPPALYGREQVMRVRRHIDLDNAAGADLTPVQNNRHDAGFANDVSRDVTIQRRGHQAGHEAIELEAGISKACYLDESRRPETQARPGRQREKINAARSDVFPEISWRHRKALASKFLMKFGVDEMDLPQVGRCRVSSHERPVLHRGAQMGIPFDP